MLFVKVFCHIQVTIQPLPFAGQSTGSLQPHGIQSSHSNCAVGSDMWNRSRSNTGRLGPDVSVSAELPKIRYSSVFITEEAVLEAAVEVEEGVVLDSATSHAAVELLAEIAASTEAWDPLLGVVEKPQASAVVFKSAP